MINRPSWDEYFLLLAFTASLRSDDPIIKHGAVIVKDNHVIGMGYNGTIKGSDHSKIPMHDRDARRPYMIHSEENSILNCSSNPNMIGGAKMYVTGLSCVNCLQRVINFGITELYQAQRAGTITENDKTAKMRDNLIEMSGIKVYTVDIRDNKWLKQYAI
jgi:dCMP deaminase